MDARLMEEFQRDYGLEIKEYLINFPNQVYEIYKIKVPKNLNELTDKEFLKYVASIQNKVYLAVKEMRFPTPFYYLINQFLFVSKYPIEIVELNSKENLCQD